MVSSKRRLKENAAHPNSVGNEKDAIDRLTEFALHLELRMRETKRLNLPKVRLDMIEYITCEVLLDIVRRVIDVEQPR